MSWEPPIDWRDASGQLRSTLPTTSSWQHLREAAHAEGTWQPIRTAAGAAERGHQVASQVHDRYEAVADVYRETQRGYRRGKRLMRTGYRIATRDPRIGGGGEEQHRDGGYVSHSSPLWAADGGSDTSD